MGPTTRELMEASDCLTHEDSFGKQEGRNPCRSIHSPTAISLQQHVSVPHLNKQGSSFRTWGAQIAVPLTCSCPLTQTTVLPVESQYLPRPNRVYGITA